MSTRNIVQRAIADDGSATIEQIIAEYEAGPSRIERSVAGMSREQLLARPIEGKWSTLEVVCHLSDCEQFFADRIKRTIATENPLLFSRQAGTYPEPLFYHRREIRQELQLIELTRAQVAGLLKWLPSESWLRTANHTDVGLVTLRQLVLHASFHVRHHLAFVDEKRQAMSLATVHM